MIEFLKPAAQREQLLNDEAKHACSRLRRQDFIGIFMDYAGYYIAWKNFSLTMPNLIEEDYSKAELGVSCVC